MAILDEQEQTNSQAKPPSLLSAVTPTLPSAGQAGASLGKGVDNFKQSLSTGKDAVFGAVSNFQKGAEKVGSSIGSAAADFAEGFSPTTANTPKLKTAQVSKPARNIPEVSEINKSVEPVAESGVQNPIQKASVVAPNLNQPTNVESRLDLGNGSFASANNLSPEQLARFQKTAETGRTVPTLNTDNLIKSQIGERVASIGAAARRGDISTDQALRMIDEAEGGLNQINEKQFQQQQAQKQSDFSAKQKQLAANGDVKGMFANILADDPNNKEAAKALGEIGSGKSKKKLKKSIFSDEKIDEKFPQGLSSDIRSKLRSSEFNEQAVQGFLNELSQVSSDPAKVEQMIQGAADNGGLPVDVLKTLLGFTTPVV